jgi:voltage-gated potassium channel Kch
MSPPDRPVSRTGRLGAALPGYRRHRFAWLFLSLLVTLGVGPLSEVVTPGFDLLALLLAINLLAAIGTAARERWFQLLLVLGAAFVAARGAHALIGVRFLVPAGQLLWVSAGVLAMVTTLRHALRAGTVDAERIFAALDVYLLAGLMFAVCYWLIDQGWPASFGPDLENGLTLARAIYFSFVTIATLGYGDIVPVSDLAQGLAILEAISGQLYVAVLIARLVGLYARPTDR